MIGIRIGTNFLNCEGVGLKLNMTNPLFSQLSEMGEYSYPFDIPITAHNLTVLGFDSDLNISERNFISVEAYLYLDGFMFSRGNLEVQYYNHDKIDATFKFNLSVLSELKSLKLNQLNWGGKYSIAAHKQKWGFTFDTNCVNKNAVLNIDLGVHTFLLAPTIPDGLADIEAFITSNTFFGGQAISVNITGNTIYFEAEWLGVDPVFSMYLDCPTGTVTNILAFAGKTVYRRLWDEHMQAVNAQTYPDVKHCFFPVMNEGSGIPWSPYNAYGYIPVVIQNYFHSQDGKFDVYIEQSLPNPSPPPAIYPNTTRSITCPTPFMYLNHYFDTIFGAVNLSIINNWLAGLPFVIWSNWYVDMVDDGAFSNDILADNWDFADTVPKVTVEEFLQTVLNTMGSVIMPCNRGTSFEIITFNDVLTGLDVIDWTSKWTGKYKIHGQPAFDKVEFNYDREERDEASGDRVNAIGKLIWKGMYNTISDAPELFPDPNTNDLFYIYIVDENKFYVRHFVSGTTYSWDLLSNSTAPIIFGQGQNVLDIKISDPILDYIGPDYIGGFLSSWKVPYVKQKLSHLISNNHVADTKVRILYFAGMKLDSLGNSYPLGTATNADFSGDDIGILNLTHDGGPATVFSYFYKNWLDFIVKAEKIEMEMSFTIFDLMQIDYRKKYNIKGSLYFLYDYKVELPLSINNKVTVTFLRIK